MKAGTGDAEGMPKKGRKGAEAPARCTCICVSAQRGCVSAQRGRGLNRRARMRLVCCACGAAVRIPRDSALQQRIGRRIGGPTPRP